MKKWIIAVAAIIVLDLICLGINIHSARIVDEQQRLYADFSKAQTFEYQANPEKKKCLLIHGMTGSTHEVRGLAVYLQKYGISSRCPRLKGHGTSVFDVEKTKVADLLEQVRAEVKKNHYDYLVGVCVGSNLVVDLAAEGNYEKIVLISPLFKYKKVAIVGDFSRFIPIIKLGYRYYHKKDPNKYEDLIDYKILPVANIYDLWQYNKKFTLKKLDKIDEKTLILFGAKDDLYDPGLPTFLKLKIMNSNLIMIKNGDHVLTKIKEKEKVFEIIRDFLLSEK